VSLWYFCDQLGTADIVLTSRLCFGRTQFHIIISLGRHQFISLSPAVHTLNPTPLAFTISLLGICKHGYYPICIFVVQLDNIVYFRLLLSYRLQLQRGWARTTGLVWKSVLIRWNTVDILQVLDVWMGSPAWVLLHETGFEFFQFSILCLLWIRTECLRACALVFVDFHHWRCHWCHAVSTEKRTPLSMLLFFLYPGSNYTNRMNAGLQQYAAAELRIISHLTCITNKFVLSLIKGEMSFIKERLFRGQHDQVILVTCTKSHLAYR
jgi:hypothetical protein